MDKNPLLKYVMKPAESDVFHSSVYGKMQNGSGMGSTSSESFSERMKREGSRTMVRKYGSSSVANNAIGNGPRAKTFTPPAKENAGGARPVGAGVGSVGTGARPVGAKSAMPPLPKNPGISR